MFILFILSSLEHLGVPGFCFCVLAFGIISKIELFGKILHGIGLAKDVDSQILDAGKYLLIAVDEIFTRSNNVIDEAHASMLKMFCLANALSVTITSTTPGSQPCLSEKVNHRGRQSLRRSTLSFGLLGNRFFLGYRSPFRGVNLGSQITPIGVMGAMNPFGVHLSSRFRFRLLFLFRRHF